MGIDFNNFIHFPDLWVWFLAKIHLLVNFLGIFGLMSMIFRKISGFKGALFRNFSIFMGGTFTI